MTGDQTGSLFGDALSSGSKADRAQAACSHIVRVALESGADSEFDYFLPDDLWPVRAGQRLKVPFGRSNKTETAFCTCAEVAREDSFIAVERRSRLKRVIEVVDAEPLIDERLMELARWMSEYYVCPLGQVLAAIVPAAVKHDAGVRTERYVYLTGPADGDEQKVRGDKQRAVMQCLQRAGATDKDRAVSLRAVMAGAGCTEAPIKSLAQRALVRVIDKTVLSALPAVPQTLAGRTTRPAVLNEDQVAALAHIGEQLESGRFAVTLLHGVTDSGKTEVYIRAIEQTLAMGKGAIVLLPEIALTAQTVQRFSERFETVAVMHSGLTAAQRNVQWRKIKAGQANVVIGARSAVFAPLGRCGLIVVDEEHEPSYKQDTAPRYHGRDVAIKRAQIESAQCILGSATPSLESLANCDTKASFTRVRLPRRVMDLPMPQMRLVDMRSQGGADRGSCLLSEPLAEALRRTLERGEQAILLLNRRGYSNFVFCPSCKHTLHCRNCDVTLTFHKRKGERPPAMKTITGSHIGSGYAVCHYCLAQTLVPEKCSLCGRKMAMIGLGSQRLEEELGRRFPQAKVRRIDSDSMAGGDYYGLLEDFGAGRIDILAGTQMLAKGLHFPNVTLVGIVSADTCLYLPDFRTNERTFQLIRQVAGRAGRCEKPGTVYVQSFMPDQPAIRFAVDGDFEGFVAEELKCRKACNLPPYHRLARIVLRDQSFERLQAACDAMKQRIDGIVACGPLEVAVRGPMPAVISRIQGFHRMQIIIQAPDAGTIQRLFSSLRRGGPVKPAVRIAIDVDPVNLL